MVSFTRDYVDRAYRLMEGSGMRCEKCQGEGSWKEVRNADSKAAAYYFLVICPECRGSGIAHCCEGERPEK